MSDSQNRLLQLAGLQEGQDKPAAGSPQALAKFKSRFETERVKMLWQFARDQSQMDFKMWQEYLEAHCEEVTNNNIRLD